MNGETFSRILSTSRRLLLTVLRCWQLQFQLPQGTNWFELATVFVALMSLMWGFCIICHVGLSSYCCWSSSSSFHSKLLLLLLDLDFLSWEKPSWLGMFGTAKVNSTYLAIPRSFNQQMELAQVSSREVQELGQVITGSMEGDHNPYLCSRMVSGVLDLSPSEWLWLLTSWCCNQFWSEHTVMTPEQVPFTDEGRGIHLKALGRIVTIALCPQR